ncbi:hypothetical protein MMC25_004244 [Agyrium rufum]|nr:hypothetical protein [Agyrium rufum]
MPSGGEKQAVYILGVGLTPFVKPSPSTSYMALALQASVKALLDANLDYSAIQIGVGCYCFGDSTCGQRCFYQLGMTGIPIYNVNNNCATGSSGLHLAKTMLERGVVSTAMVLGFEKMERGSLSAKYKDRENPIGRFMEHMVAHRGFTTGPGTAQLFGNGAREYMERYGAKAEDFAEIARINHAHSVNNPYSQFREAYTIEQIQASAEQYAPLTKLQCCPTSDGAACAVLVNEDFLAANPQLRKNAVYIAAMSMHTDGARTFESSSSMDLVGYDMSRQAARDVYAEAGIPWPASAKQGGQVGAGAAIQVCELHDCFSANEMLTLDALGLCEEGKAHEMVRQGDITYSSSASEKKGTSRVVVNPSGGLISKGHPLGATGLAQAAELVWQLRGWANNRFVETRNALQHNLGLGGAVIVAVYRRADGQASRKCSDTTVAKETGLGYNPAIEARDVSQDQIDKVRAPGQRSRWAEDGTRATSRL